MYIYLCNHTHTHIYIYIYIDTTIGTWYTSQVRFTLEHRNVGSGSVVRRSVVEPVAPLEPDEVVAEPAEAVHGEFHGKFHGISMGKPRKSHG